MTISDETLMAFADDELDASTRQAVETAMRSDPELERRVARHRALRARLQEAFGAELKEPVPERLIMAARKAAPLAAVVDMAQVRNTASRRPPRALVSPWQLGSMAASLVVGVGLGYFAWQGSSQTLMREARGNVLAEGRLANALTNQLSADRDASSAIRTGISFVAKSGAYCRTFSTATQQSSSGLACRSGSDWQIKALIQSGSAAPQASGFRTASSDVAPQILQLVETQIAGEPLDAQGEALARAGQWTSTVRP